MWWGNKKWSHMQSLQWNAFINVQLHIPGKPSVQLGNALRLSITLGVQVTGCQQSHYIAAAQNLAF